MKYDVKIKLFICNQVLARSIFQSDIMHFNLFSLRMISCFGNRFFLQFFENVVFIRLDLGGSQIEGYKVYMKGIHS